MSVFEVSFNQYLVTGWNDVVGIEESDWWVFRGMESITNSDYGVHHEQSDDLFDSFEGHNTLTNQETMISHHLLPMEVDSSLLFYRHQ